MRRAWVTTTTAALLTLAALTTAPAPAAGAAGATASPIRVSMAFTGDVLLHRPILAQAVAYGGGATHDFTPMFAPIAPLVSAVDLAVCHLETPVAPPGEPLSYHPIYGVPAEIAPALAATGYDRCSTASNHSADRGVAGIDATVTALERAGLGNSGMARTPAEAEPQVVTVNGLRLSHLSYTYGLNGLVLPADQPWRVRLLDPDRILADARLARDRGAEYVVVSLHWGNETDWRVTAAQRALAEVLTASGAVDLIVGHHVHVLQPIEQINGVWVVYGLSNILSNLPGGAERFPPSAQDGAVVTVAATRQADGTITTSRPVARPTWVDHDGYLVRDVLADLADPATPAGRRAALAESLARTRAVLGSHVPAGPLPPRCDVPAPAPPPAGFTVDDRPARFVPLAPTRVFDSRASGDDGYVCPGETVTVPIAGLGGVPATGATAAVLNVTAVDAGGAGFVTVWPAGAPRPTASSLNLTRPGQVRPNLVLVPLGEAGAVQVFAQSGAHVVVDVAGWFEPSGPVAAGRVVAVDPARVLDTRTGGGAPVVAGGTVDVAIAGRAGVPATGVAAVVVNLTATDAAAAGFVTAWPAGEARPTASSVNVAGPGEVAPNLAMVRLGAGGAVSLYAHVSMHLVADVVGYVTDGTAPVTTAGRFVPIAPARVFDTREPAPMPGPVAPGATATLVHTGRAGLPSAGVGAVALNVTAVDAARAGYVTVHPGGTTRPLASTLNVVAGDTRANAAVVRPGADGGVSYTVQPGAHLVVDATGWFTT